MEDGIGTDLVGQFGHGADGHDGADLVVYHHNGNQNGVFAQSILQGLQGDPALGVRGKIGDVKALTFQLLHAVQNGVVLDGSGDDVLSTLAHTLHGAENGPVVRLCSAGGEENPIRFSTQGGCNLAPCNPQGMGGIQPEAVQGTGITPTAGHCVRNCLHRLGTGFRCGRIV